jgi:hypothetical protein
VDLQALSQVAQILGGIAVVVAIFFGIAQIRQFKQQRLDVAAIEIMRSIQDREFTRAFRLIYSLEEGVGAHGLRNLGPEYEDAAITIGTRFETMGLLVFQKSIPFQLVEQQIGGAVVLLWNKLQPWAEDYRTEQKHPLLFEWFQWLAEQLRQRGRSEQVPAYVRHQNWTPT